MTKQYKLIGAYCSPLFINLENLHASLIADINKKRNILICNLLTNFVEVSNIPFNSLTATTYKINLPLITVIDICKAILKARNTTLSQDEILIAILKAAWPLIKT